MKARILPPLQAPAPARPTGPVDIPDGRDVLTVHPLPAGGVRIVQCRESRDLDSLGSAVPRPCRTRRVLVHLDTDAPFALADRLADLVGDGPAATVRDLDGGRVEVGVNGEVVRLEPGEDRRGGPVLVLGEVGPDGAWRSSAIAAMTLRPAAARALVPLLRRAGEEADSSGRGSR